MKTHLLLITTLVHFTALSTASANRADQIEDRFIHKGDRTPIK